MPRVPLQTLTSVRQNEAPIQSGAFQETAQATSNLMGAIGGAAKTVQAMFDQAQDFKNRSDIMEKRRIIREAEGKFLNEMAGMDENGNVGQPVPPEQWSRLWQERLKSLQKDVVEDKDATPVVRRNVEEVFKDFSGTSFIQIAGAALKETRRNAKQNYSRDYQFYTENRRYDLAREATAEAAQGGVLDEETANDVYREIDQREKKYNQEKEIVSDPKAAKEAAEADENLDPIEKEKRIRAADAQIQMYESRELDVLNAAISSEEVNTLAELEKFLESSEYITEENKVKIRKGFASNSPISDKVRWGLKKELRQLQELGEAAPQSKEYYEAFMAYQKKVLSYGPRPGMEAFRGTLYQMEQKALIGKSDKERGSFRSDIDSNMVGIASAMAKGQASKEAAINETPILTEKEYTKANGPGSEASYPAYVKEQKAAAAEAATRRATKQEVLEKAFYDAANEFIREIPPSEMTPETVLAKVREHLEKNKNEIILKAMDTAGIEFPFWGGTSEKFSDKQREKFSTVIEDVMGVPPRETTPSEAGGMLPELNTIPDR